MSAYGGLKPRWLMVLRVVTVTTLLVTAFAMEVLLRPGETLRPLFVLTAAAYGMVLLYAALTPWLEKTRAFLVLQLCGDALLVTGFVAITGGLASPMSFLYLLPICLGALLISRNGALALAAACWTLFVALVLVGDSWSVVESLGAAADREPIQVGYTLAVHLLAFVAVALLSSSLAERLRDQGRELVERRGVVARLQALTENIIESINSGLVTTDLEGRVNFINRGGCEILGQTQAEVQGLAVESLFEFEVGFLREIRRHLLANRRFRFEKWLEVPGRRRMFLGIAASSLHDRSGRPLGTIFIFQDLTEIHALEQQVRLRERMAALGGMAAGMAHELRNPLAAISGAVQYLKTSVRPEGETLELMDIILRESQRLDGTIRDFLTFARPGTFAPQWCDLVRLVEDSAKLLGKSREFGARHRIETRYDADEMWCHADPNRLKQVFWNLATNALKAMPHGGTLGLEVRHPGADDQIEISFSDDGAGMDEREVEGYFQPFRGSFRTGTGLGAAIVYRLVEEHGGRIVLETAPGRGTKVRVLLPQGGSGASTSPEPRPLLNVAGGQSR